MIDSDLYFPDCGSSLLQNVGTTGTLTIEAAVGSDALVPEYDKPRHRILEDGSRNSYVMIT